MSFVRDETSPVTTTRSLGHRSVAVSAHVFDAFGVAMERQVLVVGVFLLVSGVVYCYHTPTDGVAKTFRHRDATRKREA